MSKRIEKKKQKKQAVTAASAVQVPAGKANLYIQYQDQEYLADEVLEMVRKKCMSEGLPELEDLSIYLKPEERKAYYTCGGNSGAVEI